MTYDYHYIPTRIVEEWADEEGFVSTIVIEDDGVKLSEKPYDELFTERLEAETAPAVPEDLESFTTEAYSASLEALMTGKGGTDTNPFWAASLLVTEMLLKIPSSFTVPGKEEDGEKRKMTLSSLIECDKRLWYCRDALIDLKYALVEAPEDSFFLLGDNPLYIGRKGEGEDSILSSKGAFFLLPLTRKRAVIVFDSTVYSTYVDTDKRIVLSSGDVDMINRSILKKSRIVAVGGSDDIWSLYILHVERTLRKNSSGEEEDYTVEKLDFVDVSEEMRGQQKTETRKYCSLLDTFRKREIEEKGIAMFSDEAEEKESDFVWSWIFSQIGNGERR